MTRSELGLTAHVASLTCFSKALGTSLRSSLRLLLILSRRRFSIICGQTWSREYAEHRTPRARVSARTHAQRHMHSPLDASSSPAPEWTSKETWSPEEIEYCWRPKTNSHLPVSIVFIFIFILSKWEISTQELRGDITRLVFIFTTCVVTSR